MWEFLLLLLPIAAGYGWYMGQRSAEQKYQQEQHQLTKEYVDYVGYLLTNDSKDAVNAFCDLLEDDANLDKFEAHLILGSLFRNRGELDRALNIHQTLLDNSSLENEQRLIALRELGLDFLAIGFYDRAENAFLQLLNENGYSSFALKQLLNIYQIIGNWKRAILMAKNLTKIEEEKAEYEDQIAHFYCELAAKEIENNDYNEAQNLLKKAQSVSPNNVRTSIMRGQIFYSEQNFLQAIKEFENILDQDPVFINEILVFLKNCYEKTNENEKWRQFLLVCISKNTGNSPELALADEIESKEGELVAQNFIYQTLQKKPSINGFSRLMDYYIRQAEEGNAKKGLILLQNLVVENGKLVPAYLCEKCGFSSQNLYWNCPSCRTWSSIKPNFALTNNNK